ncbi:hypothetical protein LXL04_019777 [Taraxacum kok-saghyz]
MAWDKVIASKQNGGLGVVSIKALNTALMIKWWWRLRTNPQLLWCRAIAGIHNLHSKPPDYYANKRIIGTWKNIAGVKKELIKAGIPPSDVMSSSGEPERSDWRCNLSPDGRFTIRILRRKIDDINSAVMAKFDWKEIPKNVLCFTWRAKMGRIPSAVALCKRGVVNQNNFRGGSCNMEDECADHILVQCPFAKTVMEWILKWCDIKEVRFNTVTEVLDYAAGWGNFPKKRRILLAIFQGTMWSIWKARNDRLFGNRRIPPTKVADMIKSMVFIWIKHRRPSGGSKNWTDWKSHTSVSCFVSLYTAFSLLNLTIPFSFFRGLSLLPSASASFFRLLISAVVGCGKTKLIRYSEFESAFDFMAGFTFKAISFAYRVSLFLGSL